MTDLTDVMRQLQELYHNLFRMHSYVEAAFNVQEGQERPELLKRADLLLTTSQARVKLVLPEDHWGRLEPVQKGE